MSLGDVNAPLTSLPVPLRKMSIRRFLNPYLNPHSVESPKPVPIRLAATNGTTSKDAIDHDQADCRWFEDVCRLFLTQTEAGLLPPSVSSVR